MFFFSSGRVLKGWVGHDLLSSGKVLKGGGCAACAKKDVSHRRERRFLLKASILRRREHVGRRCPGHARAKRTFRVDENAVFAES